MTLMALIFDIFRNIVALAEAVAILYFLNNEEQMLISRSLDRNTLPRLIFPKL
jgi:hypothetical protein